MLAICIKVIQRKVVRRREGQLLVKRERSASRNSVFYIAHGSLHNAMWQPGWEGSFGENVSHSAELSW